MNLSTTYILASILLLCSTAKLQAEFVSVVELADLRGNTSYQICTDEEKKKLDLDLRAEDKAFTKALELTKVQWNTMYKGTAFPSSRIKERSMRVITTTSKREEADKVLSKWEDQKERAISRKKAEEESILKKKPTRSSRGRSNNNASIAREQKEVKEDRESDANADKAEDLLRKNLSTSAGHEVPFFGKAPEKAEPKKAAAKKK